VEHGLAIQKAERKRDREWVTISNRLQKQLGEEQTRVAHLQLQSVRQERMFKSREAGHEQQLKEQHVTRQREQDAYQV
jgi:hypothetical protein